MEIDKEKLLMYIFIQLKNGNFDSENKDEYILDSQIINFIKENESSLKLDLEKYVELFLNALTASAIFEKELSDERFSQLINNYKFKNKGWLSTTVYYGIYNYIVANGVYDKEYIIKAKHKVINILLKSIYKFGNEYINLSTDEIKSFFIFGRNFFQETQN